MKTIMYAALAATALAFAAAPGARAQDDAPPQDSGAAAPADAGAGPRAGARGDKMMERLAARLGLNDDQSAKLRSAFQAHRAATRASRDHLRVVMAKLREQVDSGASDNDIKATLEHLRADHRAMPDSQEEFERNLASFLTPTQRAKLLLGFAGHHRPMRGEGRDKGGEGPGDGSGPDD